jgi:hypothetical protein
MKVLRRLNLELADEAVDLIHASWDTLRNVITLTRNFI